MRGKEKTRTVVWRLQESRSGEASLLRSIEIQSGWTSCSCTPYCKAVLSFHMLRRELKLSYRDHTAPNPRSSPSQASAFRWPLMVHFARSMSDQSHMQVLERRFKAIRVCTSLVLNAFTMFAPEKTASRPVM